jgi:hypothetical protein
MARHRARAAPAPARAGGGIAAQLAAREGCNVRALALRAWPTLPAAEAALRSSCFACNRQAWPAFARLGVALPADARLPTFPAA